MPALGARIEALDGIRAIAVTAVVVYHLVPEALPGGFLADAIVTALRSLTPGHRPSTGP